MASTTFPTPVAPPSTTTAPSATAKSTTSLNQNFDQFLLLLTTQLKNQDPLSPMDATEFTNQLVSFSQVEQQIRMNDNLSKMVALSKNSQTILGLSYIGLNVDMTGTDFLHAGGAAKMSYTLPDSAAINTISILDKNGNTVYSQSGDLTKGTHEFIWNGTSQNGQPAPPGAYHLRVGALDSEQKNIPVTTTVPGRVEGIQTDDNGDILLLINGQEVPMSSIRKASL